MLAGLVPTKSGLLFAGDTHGNLLVLDARAGTLLKRIDAGGALNNGLISYSAGGAQYVAAAVGGATENPSRVAGALRVVVYGLRGPDKPVTTTVTLDRLPASAAAGWTASHMLFVQACQQCHGAEGGGSSAPPLNRQSQLSDPDLLKRFLATVPPPMPVMYPDVLDDDDVRMLAEYLRSAVFKCGPDEVQSCNAPAHPTSGGTKEWLAIYRVLTSPRCMNCHPVASKLPPLLGLFAQDYPRQGDDRHPHYYSVVRGDTAAFETAENTAVVHVGMGAPLSAAGRAMAPAAMAFESAPGVPLTGKELCARLKDKSRNGSRELADTLHHVATEPLVLWSWTPGKRLNGETRTTPPIDHDAFVQAFAAWMKDGAPCPGD